MPKPLDSRSSKNALMATTSASNPHSVPPQSEPLFS